MTDISFNPATDHDYNARDSVPSFDAAYGALLSLSDTARAILPCQADLVYDPDSGMALDLYGAAPGRPVFLWIHGGYWRIGSKDGNAFAAPGLLGHNIAVAVMGYSLAPKASLYDIVHQVRLAVAWLKREGPAFGLDTSHIHVGGTSAGGQLVGALLAQGWHQRYGLATNTIGAALALSGIFDLAPLRATQVNDWMNLDAHTIADLSPIRHLPNATEAQLLLSVGGQERPGFLRETANYAAAWAAKGHPGKTIPGPDHDHFSIAGTLSDPSSTITRTTADTIQAYAKRAIV